MSERKGITGDIAGGLSAAIIALPLALGFGVISFGPLNDPAAGALAGLYGAIFTGIFAAIFGGTPSQITGPTGPMTVVTTSVVATIMKYEQAHSDGGEVDLSRVFVLVFLTGMLGGAFQIFLGVIRAGRLIKFIPYPVIAGFMNGIAVIIFLGQVKPFLGMTGEQNLVDLAIRPAVLGTAIATVIIIVATSKLLPKLPAGLVGLAGGTAAFFALAALFDPDLLIFEGNKLIVGEIPRAIPTPKYLLEVVTNISSFSTDHFKLIIAPALALGVLGAIDSLLTSLVADVATRTRHNSDRELIGQGIGNIVAGAFGGFSGAGATVRTLVNTDNGGRNRISGVIHGATLLLVLVALGPLAGWIPMSVLAGILVVTAVNMVDNWSIKLLRKKTARADSVVVVLVTVITVVVDLMVAVGIGMAISLILFMRELISRPAARAFRGTHHRSKRVRGDEDVGILEEHGSRILIYELDGPLFFGNTDRFSQDVEVALRETKTDIMVLDLRRVPTVDITGAELIKRIVDTTSDSGVRVILSSFNPYVSEKRQAMLEYMRELNVIQSVGEDNIFPGLDEALENAEDDILGDYRPEDTASKPAEDIVRSSVLFKDMSDEEWGVIEPLLERVEYKAKDIIWGKGQPGGSLNVIERGHVSVSVYMEDHPEAVFRQATFGAGRHFGSQTFLEARPREGHVKADEDTVVHRLTIEEFEKLERDHPGIALKILRGHSHRLAERLRVTSQDLLEYED
jgi:SulP family sulfate permease